MNKLAYKLGFLSTCIEHGIPDHISSGMLKRAYVQQNNISTLPNPLKMYRAANGRVASFLDRQLASMERQAKQTADMNIPFLSWAAKGLQPMYVGTRAALAKGFSGGGRYYTPQVRDERYFSNDALAEIKKNLARNGGRGTTRDQYSGSGGRTGMFGNAASWEASQALGGSTSDGKYINDTFDINTGDTYGEFAATRELLGSVPYYAAKGFNWGLGKLFGTDKDPNAGKVQTRIPISAIKTRVAK